VRFIQGWKHGNINATEKNKIYSTKRKNVYSSPVSTKKKKRYSSPFRYNINYYSIEKMQAI